MSVNCNCRRSNPPPLPGHYVTLTTALGNFIAPSHTNIYIAPSLLLCFTLCIHPYFTHFSLCRLKWLLRGKYFVIVGKKVRSSSDSSGCEMFEEKWHCKAGITMKTSVQKLRERQKGVRVWATCVHMLFMSIFSYSIFLSHLGLEGCSWRTLSRTHKGLEQEEATQVDISTDHVVANTGATRMTFGAMVVCLLGLRY